MPQQQSNIPQQSEGDFLYASQINEIIQTISGNADDSNEQLQDSSDSIELNVFDPRVEGVEASLNSIGTSLDGVKWVKVGEDAPDWEKVFVSKDGDFESNIRLVDSYGYLLGNQTLGITAGDLAAGDGVKPGGHQRVSRIGEGDKYVFGDFVFEGDANGNGVLVAGPADSAAPLEIPYTWFPVKIDDGLFSVYINTTSLHIPMSVREIGNEAFRFFAWISSVPYDLKIPDSVTKIGDDAFKDNFRVKSLQLSNNLREIGDNAFRTLGTDQDDLITFNLPGKVETIGENAFDGAKVSGTLTLPRDVFIGSSAFKNCPLTDVNLDERIAYNQNLAYLFRGCDNLTGHPKPLRMASYFTGQPDVIKYCTGMYSFCDGFTGTLTLSNEVGRSTHVEEDAFAYCSNLSSVEILDQCYLKSQAFSQCTGMTGTLYFPNFNHSLDACNTGFGHTNFDKVYLPHEDQRLVSNKPFLNCLLLKDFYFNNGPSDISDNAFEGSGLERVHVRPAPHTPDGWTIGPNQTIGGVSNVEVVADWTNWPEQQN